MAADMRKTLFASLLRCISQIACSHGSSHCALLIDRLHVEVTATNAVIVTFPHRQDVAFFDANKTGQLVNRLTSDIQEFKSSFKLVISQVLSENLCCKIINV